MWCKLPTVAVQPKMGGTKLALRLLSLTVGGWLKMGIPELPPLSWAGNDSIRINVTTMKDDDISKEQVVNITCESRQV